MNNTRYKLRNTNYKLRIGSLLIFVICCCFCLFASSVTYCQPSGKDSISCIEIRFDADGQIFPSRWYNPKINARAESLVQTEKGNVINCLYGTFAKYPREVLCKYLTKVFVLKSMRFYGVSYGGTSSGQVVYIIDDYENYNCSYDLLENYFHHEFSSILLHKNRCSLKKKQWKKINPPDFHYGKGGLQAIINSLDDMTFNADLNEKGFLTRYSQASLEEDFNVYCQNIFNGGYDFWQIVKKFPKVKAKTDLVIQFYHNIDTLFTEKYFKSLSH